MEVDLREVDYLAAAKVAYKDACDFPSMPEKAMCAIAAALIAIAEGMKVASENMALDTGHNR